jgi:hypothetical protein
METGTPADLLIDAFAPPRADVFRTHFDSEPFEFTHRLCDDERFSWEKIRALAERVEFKNSYSGALPVKDGFKQPTPEKLTYEETLSRLETEPGWIILKKVHRDSEYSSVIRECQAALERRTHRRFGPLIESQSMSLIISSPGQITPYHVDDAVNFLFQLHGPKTLYVFNGKDRSVLPEEEEERYWAGEMNAATYREENQAKAWAFALRPGNGVHVPVTFPHWAKSGEKISVGLSVNFRFHGRIRGDLYRMNHTLRRLGIQPRPAGESPLADLVKTAVYSPSRMASQMFKRVLGRFGRGAT